MPETLKTPIDSCDGPSLIASHLHIEHEENLLATMLSGRFS